MKVGSVTINPNVLEFLTILFSVKSSEHSKDFIYWLYCPEDRLVSFDSYFQDTIIREWYSSTEMEPVYCLGCLSKIGECLGGDLRFACPKCLNNPVKLGYIRNSALLQISHLGTAPIVVHFLNHFIGADNGYHSKLQGSS